MVNMRSGDWISAEDAAVLIGVSRDRVYAFLKSGRLKSTKVGRDHLLLRAEVEAFAKLPRKSGRPTSKKPRKKN